MLLNEEQEEEFLLDCYCGIECFHADSKILFGRPDGHYPGEVEVCVRVCVHETVEHISD